MLSQEILKGTIKPLIIKLIKESSSGEMYGYQITQKVKELSSGEIILTEGALYPALHKLVEEKILSVRKTSVGNRERKYYSLTILGEKTAVVRLNEIRDAITILVRLFHIETLSI
jgi:DNA-binding PadR family transcriptional regulator